ncbi:hypothetical protein [uncultured Nocardioides sp.]|uniref:hypothetical protein n=1 Tax=uncultured Nocardioides sp. TaxID=198441 RepID=UPI0026046B05|nr:hypothetical protein [uncultured Nocardioides sp.]
MSLSSARPAAGTAALTSVVVTALLLVALTVAPYDLTRFWWPFLAGPLLLAGALSLLALPLAQRRAGRVLAATGLTLWMAVGTLVLVVAVVVLVT